MSEFHLQPRSTVAIDTSSDVYSYSWVVTGLVTPAQVLADAEFPVEFNDVDPFEPTSGRKCNRIQVNATGLSVYSITASFQVPPASQWEQFQKPDAAKPLLYQWDTVTENIAIDRDKSGNGIITSAYRAPGTSVTQTRNYKRLTITKWMNGYDLARAMAYENTVNSVAWQGAAAGEVKCNTIQPSVAFQSSAMLIPIAHIFSFKATLIWQANPWQTFIKDQDGYGYVSGVKRRILTKEGVPVDDVPLDGTGEPIETSLYYYRETEGGPIIDPPAWTGTATPTGATVIGSGKLRFLRYDTLPQTSFAGLGL